MADTCEGGEGNSDMVRKGDGEEEDDVYVVRRKKICMW